eukprot:13360746-Heterocapsa_arctica.AAC.1
MNLRKFTQPVSLYSHCAAAAAFLLRAGVPTQRERLTAAAAGLTQAPSAGTPFSPSAQAESVRPGES